MGRKLQYDWWTAFNVSGGAVLLLFGIELAKRITGYPLDRLGILPRTQSGLIGIAASPLLHGSWGHLTANAMPLLILLTLLFADRQNYPVPTLLMIWVASGLGTWLIGGGDAIHIGASSIIFGLVAYLILAGFLRHSWRSALVAIFVLFAFGGIFYGILPQSGPISWEGHLCGAAAGAWAAQRNFVKA